MKKFILFLIMASLILANAAAFADQSGSDMTLIPGVLTRNIAIKDSYPDNPVIEGESSTTGLPYSGQYVPILVVFDDSEQALPQWGIADADIIYQMPNAGTGATKLCALFADTVPERAGGVRSARVPFVELRESWDAVFVHRGMPGTSVATAARVDLALKKYNVRKNKLDYDIDDTVRKFGQRETYHAAPHNLSALLLDIKNTVLKTGYAFTERPFLFTDDLPANGLSASYIEIAHYGGKAEKGIGNPSSWSSYTYNAEKNTYLRATTEGSYVDYFDKGTQLAYSNVIVQRTSFSYAKPDYVLLRDIVGSGAADIFIGGRYIPGSWYRKSMDSRTVYLDENGNEIALQRGRTFIVVTNIVTGVTYK